jgi:enamine deaminase RidA (YjgF/YER057c/UK114 family)
MIDDVLSTLGISLPSPPTAAGSYVPVVISGNLAFVSGQIPLVGKEVRFRGKVGKDLTLEQGQEAARLCVINALAQLKAALGDLSRISRIVKVTGFVSCEPTFVDHPKVMNGASDLLVKVFGENGKHARAAVGMSSLPLDSAVEVELIAELR